MHVLVTGASGRIGLPLLRSLRAGSHTTRALVMEGDPRLEDVRAAADEVVIGEIADPGACGAAVAGVTAIAHLAGRLPQHATDAELLETNVRGTWELMAAAARRAREIEMVVFASTNDVYSVQDALYSPVDEQHPLRPVSTYGLTKVMGEHICRYHHVRSGLPVGIARFALTQAADEVLGGLTAQYFLLSARVAALRTAAETDASVRQDLATLEATLASRGEHALVLRNGAGEPWMFHICEVEDLVSGIVLFLAHPGAAGEAINLSSPAPFMTDVAAAHLAARTGLPTLDVVVEPGLRFAESTARARSLLGFVPRLTIQDILDRALEAMPGGRWPAVAGSDAGSRSSGSRPRSVRRTNPGRTS